MHKKRQKFKKYNKYQKIFRNSAPVVIDYFEFPGFENLFKHCFEIRFQDKPLFKV